MIQANTPSPAAHRGRKGNQEWGEPPDMDQDSRNTALIPTRRKGSFPARTVEDSRTGQLTQRDTLMIRRSVLKAGGKCLSRIRKGIHSEGFSLVSEAKDEVQLQPL